jgi:Fe-S cluster assembly scaffold protein SufB
MEVEQLIFQEVVIESEDRHRAAQDELRSDVQDWFDQLTPRQKDALGVWLDSSAQYDTCVALHAAAGDWNRQRMQQLRHLVNGERQQQVAR